MPSIRPALLEEFLDAVKAGYARNATDPKTRACLDRVFGALAEPAEMSGPEPVRLPVNGFLEAALQPAMGEGGELATLAGRVRDLDPSLVWRRRGGASGLEDRHDVWVGLSLLAPGTRYPDHDHPPEEIYLVLTQGQFRHGDSGWFTPGVGGTFYNEPGIEHAMRAEPDQPLLAVWFLFNPAGQTR